MYGGWDGQKAHNTLNQLNLETFAWSEVKCENPDNIPSEMSGCGLVAYGNRKLVLFGGYGAIKEKKPKKKKPTEQHELVTVENGGKDDEVNTKEENGDRNNTTEPTTVEVTTNGVDNEETSEPGNETLAVMENGVGEKERVKQNGDDKTGGSRMGGEENGGRVKEDGEREENEGGRGKEDGRVEEGGKDVGTEEQVTVKAEEEADESRKKDGMTEETTEIETQQETSGDTNGVHIMNETKNAKKKKTVVIQLPVSFELSSTSEETAIAESSNGASLPKLESEDVLAKEGTDEPEEEINMTYLIYKRNESDQKGWTNEVKVFDLDTGKY